MLKQAKRILISASKRTGLSRLILHSNWRQQRLLILCFHGISTADEHRCFPEFFITPEEFRRKLELMRKLSLSVLPLDEAITRLTSGTLPQRSAVITLDDGFYGTYVNGAPILDQAGYPAAVYITSHYIHRDWAPFDIMCRYLLWRACGSELRWKRVFDEPVQIAPDSIMPLYRVIYEYSQENRLDSFLKNELLRDLAGRLCIDYEDLRRRRILQLVRPDEMRSWRTADFHLHTHRHRVSRNKDVFMESIRRNREELRAITGRESRHFAYPGGAFLPEHGDWLRELGVESAVTCETGLAGPNSDTMFLPRIMDTSHVRLEELESWMTGFGGLLPVRRYPMDWSQFEGEEVTLREEAKLASVGNA